MAQSYTNADGITLINPGTYVSVTVQPGQGASASAGVVTLIGEADEGPGFLAESDLSSAAYTPDQFGKVQQKYGSGRLVDAFRAIVAAANDPNILGAVTLVRMIKTNQSAAAQASLAREGFDEYAQIKARKEGAPGNLIRFASAVAVAETAPSSSAFSYAPLLTGTLSFDIRINGQNKKTIAVSTKESGPALQAAMEDTLKGIMAKGGAEKLAIPASGLTISAAPAGGNLIVTLQAGQTWAASPVAGDTCVIPGASDYGAAGASAISGTGSANQGTYIVLSVTNTVSSATLTLKPISTIGAIISASGSTAADKKDVILYSQMEIKNVTGQDREAVVGVAGTYNCVSNDGTNIKIDLPTSTSFAARPQAGDILRIDATFAGVTAGFYQVASSTTSSVNAYRLSDGSAGVTGSQLVTGPVLAANQPFRIEAPVIDGLGKSLCIEGSVSSIMKNASGVDAALSDSQKVSAAELENQMTYKRGSSSESFTAGGEICLLVGSDQEDSRIEIGSSQIDFYANSALVFSAPYAQFKTLSDLVVLINSQSGFSASIPSARMNSYKPEDLDEGSFGIAGIAAHKNGRIKRDAADWIKENGACSIASQSLSEFAGLPEAKIESFLSGGSKNGTTSALATAAIDACEKLETNFLVPIFSADAADDIAAEETESSSTYSVDAINAYMKSHVLKMSALKLKKNRIAVGSKQASYAECKEAAGEMASARFGLCFQEVKNVSASGELKMYQPWMAAVIAAGMQAAAGFKGIVKKFANVSGIAKLSGDFDANNPGDSEDALKSGLLFMERVPTGGFRWVSDQLTYSVDNNFVYNSLQAVYLADLMTLTLIERFDRLVVGKSVAEISANAALSILEAEMFNFKRLRWIAASDDAVKGYKNASAKLNGGVLEISVEVKLAGLIYFVPISLSISQVSQTA